MFQVIKEGIVDQVRQMISFQYKFKRFQPSKFSVHVLM